MRVTLNLFPEELLPMAPLRCPRELLGLLDWAIDLKLLRKTADVSHLHRWCMAEGLSPAAWRLLAKFGEKCYEAVPHENHSAPGRFTECLNYLEWQARADLRYPLPTTMGQHLLAVGVHAGSMPPVDPRLIRAAARHWISLSREGRLRLFVTHEWAPVLVWMRDVKPEFDSNQWRSGWPAIWREFQRCNAVKDAHGFWNPVLQSFSVEEFTITPIASAADVVNEGWLMRHCATDYLGTCRAGRYLMFSVTQAQTRKRLATVGIAKAGGRWKVDQVSGKSNRDPGEKIHRLARQIGKEVRQVENLWAARADTDKLVRQMLRQGRIDIRVGWEGGDAPLMALDDQLWQPASLEQLPISDDLRQRLRQWSARFRAFPPLQIIDEQDWVDMDDQLRGFAGELRQVLGAGYRVLGYE